MATRKSTPCRLRGAPPPSPAPRIESSANVHRLTVRSHYPVSRAAFASMRRDPPPMPFLHLQGRWLDRAGFTIGTNVRVSFSPGRRMALAGDLQCCWNLSADRRQSGGLHPLGSAQTRRGHQQDGRRTSAARLCAVVRRVRHGALTVTLVLIEREMKQSRNASS